MHASDTLTAENIIPKATKLVNVIENSNSLTPVDDPKQIMEILEPLIKITFNKSFKNHFSPLYNSTQRYFK